MLKRALLVLGLLLGALQPIAAQDVHILGGNMGYSVVPTIQALSYSSGNAIGALQTLPFFRNRNVASALIDNVLLAWRGTQTVAVTFYFFDTNPTGSTCTDRSAFVLAAADVSKLAIIPFTLTAAAPSVGTTSTSANSAFSPVSVNNQDSPVTANFYVCTVVGGSVTPAVGDLTYKIGAILD